MADPFSEDLPRRSPVHHDIGQDLSLLSVDELDERVERLQAEIERLKAARAAKLDSKALADGFFKSGA